MEKKPVQQKEDQLETKSAQQRENQVEMRLVRKEELGHLKEIWKLTFGDEDRFIDFYFKTRDWENETAVLLLGGQVVSMLTMIPVEVTGESGIKYRASMLYAIATHPDFQKRGFADRLIEFSNRYLLSRQISVTLLVPASEALFRFYEKCGYRDGFSVREAVLSRSDIENLAYTNQKDSPKQKDGTATSDRTEQTVETVQPECYRVTPVEAAGYNRIRRNCLEGRPYLDYRDEEISFEKQYALMSGADLFAVETSGGAAGCAYAERISQEEVVIKEILIPDQYLASVLKQISERLPGEKYYVRTPSDAGEILGGTVRHFGMIRINGNSDAVDFSSWLGIAYD